MLKKSFLLDFTKSNFYLILRAFISHFLLKLIMTYLLSSLLSILYSIAGVGNTWPAGHMRPASIFFIFNGMRPAKGNSVAREHVDMAH